MKLELFDKLKPFLTSCLKLNHDLNNSLVGVIGFTELVLSEPGQMTADQINMLDSILICAEKIKKQLEQLSGEIVTLGDPKDFNALIEGFKSTSGNWRQT